MSVSPTGGAPATLSPQQARLRTACHQLESVFLNQLFQAMRATVPEGEQQGSGEELFQSMFDEKIAESNAGRSDRGIGEALYHQLSRRLPGATQPAPR